MRLLEIVLLLSFLPALALPLIAPVRRPRIFVIVAAVLPLLAAAVHLVIEGYRWQMMPAYVLAVIVLLARLPQLLRPAQTVRRRALGIVGSVFAALILLLAFALGSLLPVFQLPAPTGEYAVGTAERYLKDNTRDRELMVQVWYPAGDVSGAQRAGYLPRVEKLAPALMSALGVPSFAFDHMRYVQAHSYVDAPAAEGAFPVLLFSHGMGAYRHQSVAQMEELASHGYIVVSIDHSGYAGAVVLPDDRVIAFTGSDELDPMNRETSEARIRETWQTDQRYVLQQVRQWSTSDALLSGHLDTARVGMFGHSFGGSTITFACEAEPTCTVSINMDGSVGVAISDDTPAWQKPYWYIMSDTIFMQQQSTPTDAQLESMELTREGYEQMVAEFVDDLHRAYALRGEKGVWVHMTGMLHQNFSDVPLSTPLFRVLGATGSIDPLRGNAVMNAYLLSIFDRYVKGEPVSPLLTGETALYPEVEWMEADDLPTA